MKKIYVIFLIISLASCGVSKKITKTESQEVTKVEVSKIDSTVMNARSEDLLYSIIEKLDLSKAVITVYNPPDSAGRQSVYSMVEVNNNVKTVATNVAKSNQETAVNNKSVEVAKTDSIINTKQATESIKSKLPFKVYFLIFSAITILVVITFILRKLKII